MPAFQAVRRRFDPGRSLQIPTFDLHFLLAAFRSATALSIAHGKNTAKVGHFEQRPEKYTWSRSESSLIRSLTPQKTSPATGFSPVSSFSVIFRSAPALSVAQEKKCRIQRPFLSTKSRRCTAGGPPALEQHRTPTFESHPQLEPLLTH